MFRQLILIVFSVLGLCLPQILSAEEPIFLMYAERAPYIIVGVDGSISGLTASPAVRAFERAGVPFVQVEIPTNRQLASIKADVSPSCGIGWFDLPERHNYARFTKQIYRDRPTVVLMHRETAVAGFYDSLEQLIADDNLTILVKTQFSYGQRIDSWLETHQPRTTSVTLDNVGMLRMVMAGRADYMLMGQEESDYLLHHSDALTKSDVRVLALPDSPHGNYRHLMCSLSVPVSVIERLNREIEEIQLP